MKRWALQAGSRLAMISPPARNFLNSTFVNVKSLRNIEAEPVLEMHASDAGARGITTGAVLRVFNDLGAGPVFYDCLVKASLESPERILQMAPAKQVA